jgi:DNA-binding NarL/FixJ family response regulator
LDDLSNMRDSQPFFRQSVPPALAQDPALSHPESYLHREIECAISSFGVDLLTAREHAVVQLILRGLSSKVVANKLHIALKTEKVHRRNAYAKLGVNSHAVLFVEFLRYLSACLALPSRDKCDTEQSQGAPGYGASMRLLRSKLTRQCRATDAASE